MSDCAARSDSTGAIRCALCRVTWDRDEVRVCAREVPTVPVATRAHDEALPAPDPKDAADAFGYFASGLAPLPWER